MCGVFLNVESKMIFAYILVVLYPGLTYMIWLFRRFKIAAIEVSRADTRGHVTGRVTEITHQNGSF